MQFRDFIADLPDVPEAAFVEFEERSRRKMREQSDDSWTSEREYINAVMAFIDEYEIQIDVPRTYSVDEGFYEYLQDVMSVIDYWNYRYTLRTQRSGLHPPIYLEIDSEYKSKIHEHIEKIRKVINVSDLSQDKKEELLKYLNSFVRELDRTNTRIDDFIRVWLRVTKAIGDGASNLEPVGKLLDKIADMCARSPEGKPQLSNQERKKIEYHESGENVEESTQDRGDNDEIPF